VRCVTWSSVQTSSYVSIHVGPFINLDAPLSLQSATVWLQTRRPQTSLHRQSLERQLQVMSLRSQTSEWRLHVQLAVQSTAAATNNQVWCCCWCQPFILLGVDNEYYTVLTLTSQTSELRLHVQLAMQSPPAATNNQVWCCCWCQPFVLLGLINEYYTVMTLTSETSELRLHVQLAVQSPAAAPVDVSLSSFWGW